MSQKRRSDFYKGYNDAAKGGRSNVTIPYSTWSRWLKAGSITVDQLRDMGITPHVRKRRKVAPSQHHEAYDEDQAPDAVDSADAEGTLNSSSSKHEKRFDKSDCLSGSSTESSSSSSSSLSSCTSSGSSMSSTSVTTSDESESELGDDDVHISSSMTLIKILNSKLLGPQVLNEPLHPNLAVSKFEVLLLILHLAMRHRMTDVFLEHLLGFVDKIVGIENSVGVSKYLIKKLFQFGRKPTAHYFCPHCDVYLGTEDSFPSGSIVCYEEECKWKASISSHNNGNFFLTLSIRDQLVDTLSKPGLKFVSKLRLNRVVSDVMDGDEYKSHSRPGRYLSNEEALTLTVNTDGSPVFKNGSNSLWPIHFYINEIEPSSRFSSDNMMLAGLWFGKCAANMNMFLEPVVAELQELEKTGVIWRKPCGTVVESPVYVICCVCDSTARPKVQNHMQFNGHFGCSICLHPNTTVEVLEKVNNSVCKKKKNTNKKSNKKVGAKNSVHNNEKDVADDVEAYQLKKMLRYKRGEYVNRTNQTLREHMKLASVGLRPHLYGSKGLSVFCSLKHFNVVHGFALDYMHALLLGTMKRLADLWFDSTSKNEPYYIGRSILGVDSRIEGITLPSGFRPPRPMSDRVHWKANEWRAFLLYFSLPVLVNILPEQYYNHFKKFVTAVYTLSKECILKDEIDSSDSLLKDFVWDYQDLYGERNMVFNVHITSHIAEAVRTMGPLWTFSAFPFESANGRLVKLAMGTKGVATQICRKYLMTKSVGKLLLNNYKVSDPVLNFCCDIVGFKYLKNFTRGRNDETMLGRHFPYELNDVQKQAIIDKNFPLTKVVQAVNRVVVERKLYHGRLTTRQTKACDSCVRLMSGEYALIDLIILQNLNEARGLADVYFLVTKLNIALDPSPLLVSHIKQCSLDPFGDVELVTSGDLSRKCKFFTCSGKNFVAEISNFFETD